MNCPRLVSDVWEDEVLETCRNRNIEDVRRKFYELSEEVMGKLP